RAVVDGAGVQLHCRPRRFGKTLNLSTLRYFFDCQGEYRHLFEGLTIADDEEMTTRYQGKYPVITLSFKDVKMGSYTSTILGMGRLLYWEWRRHQHLEGRPDYDRKIILMREAAEAGEPR
ncbi:MAG TPA: AAA family ATPase, partial [Saprospiraceae bacterium]|nr:AAA family ATPase [Saprospiraceae bacterium]